MRNFFKRGERPDLKNLAAAISQRAEADGELASLTNPERQSRADAAAWERLEAEVEEDSRQPTPEQIKCYKKLAESLAGSTWLPISSQRPEDLQLPFPVIVRILTMGAPKGKSATTSSFGIVGLPKTGSADEWRDFFDLPLKYQKKIATTAGYPSLFWDARTADFPRSAVYFLARDGSELKEKFEHSL